MAESEADKQPMISSSERFERLSAPEGGSDLKEEICMPPIISAALFSSSCCYSVLRVSLSFFGGGS